MPGVDPRSFVTVLHSELTLVVPCACRGSVSGRPGDAGTMAVVIIHSCKILLCIRWGKRDVHPSIGPSGRCFLRCLR